MLLEVINLLYYAATMIYYYPLYRDPLHIAFYRVLTFVSIHQTYLFFTFVHPV